MKKICFSFICLFFSVSLFAVPAVPGSNTIAIPKDSVKKILTINEMKALGYSPEKIQKALSTTLGTIKLAVVFVDFANVNFVENTLGTGTKIGSIQRYVSNASIAPGTKITTETGLLSNMIKYISECSYGKMTLEVYPFTNSVGYSLSPAVVSSYGKTVGTAQEAGVSNGKLFRDAVSAVVNTSGITITNTAYDALMVVHAGNGEESYTGMGSDDDDIWSLFVNWTIADGPSANGFFEGETVPAAELGGNSPFGVLCHEFGHQLGLPDLYQTVFPNSSRVGKWDLMDYGAWCGTPAGSSPPHMSSWCKAYIKWITPVEVNSSTTITLNAFESLTGNTIKVPILNLGTEYFLFEYRRNIGFDIALPGQGVLIWHIDDSKATPDRISNNIINNNSPLAVALEEQDKTNTAGSDKGTSTDPFTVSIFASPQSDSYSNGPSYITLFDFSGLGTAAMTAKLFSIPATTELVAKKAINYPNPVKNVSSTTIRVNFSRPFTTASLRIYSIAGELLFEKEITMAQLNQVASDAAHEWIYDYNWDLKNSGGNTVASGIYLYNITAEVSSQRQSKTGKLAIIR